MRRRWRRRKCVRWGHDFREFESARSPVIFCRRWFCQAAMVAHWVWREAPGMAALLDDYARDLRS